MRQKPQTSCDGVCQSHVKLKLLCLSLMFCDEPTQSLDDGKLLDDGSFLHHAHHAERQRHRHHDG